MTKNNQAQQAMHFFFKIYVLSGLMNVRTTFIGRVASKAGFRLSEALS